MPCLSSTINQLSHIQLLGLTINAHTSHHPLGDGQSPPPYCSTQLTDLSVWLAIKHLALSDWSDKTLLFGQGQRQAGSLGPVLLLVARLFLLFLAWLVAAL